MIARRSLVALGALAVLAASAGCSITRPSLERQAFAISAERPPGQAQPHNPARFPVTLKVGRIGMQPPYGGTSFVYRVGELRYEVDPYNGFLAAPNELLGQAIARWLGESGLFVAVREPASPLTGDYVLEGLVTELYGDARDTPEAVVAIQLFVRRAGAEGGIVFEHRYVQRVPIANDSADALARGYGVALGKVLEALERDLAGVKLGR